MYYIFNMFYHRTSYFNNVMNDNDLLCQLRLMSWNIHGSVNAAINDSCFKEVVNNNDIIILTETWLAEHIDIFGDNVYNYHNIRPMHARAKRPSGGISILMHHHLRNSNRGTNCQRTRLFCIVPIYKKGNICDPSNYRGISISICLGKLFTLLLNKRLQIFLEEHKIISKCQSGFRKNKRTSDHIFVLKSINEEQNTKKNKKIFGCFIDFKKEFDTVWIKGLLYKLLCKYSISPKFTRVLNSMYSQLNSSKASRAYQSLRNALFGLAIPPKSYVKLFDIHFCINKTHCPIWMRGMGSFWSQNPEQDRYVKYIIVSQQKSV